MSREARMTKHESQCTWRLDRPSAFRASRCFVIRLRHSSLDIRHSPIAMIDETYRLVFDTLRQHLTEAGVPFREDDGDLIFRGHRLGLSITFDGFTPQEEPAHRAAGCADSSRRRSGRPFSDGNARHRADRLTAIRSAIEEWHVLAAAPLLAALGSGGRHAAVDRRRSGSWPAGTCFPAGPASAARCPPGLDPGGIFYRLLIESLYKTC